MVSLTATSRKYRGRKAATYDEIRQRQLRWKIENETVAEMTADLPPGSSVLDAPCGTGRFADLWRERKFKALGVDVSQEMLEQALPRWPENDEALYVLVQSDILDFCDARNPRSFDAAVCVRFLDLIDEAAMRATVTQLCKVARRRVILTIRLGRVYVPKVNTAEHSRGQFVALVRRCGWRVEREVPVHKAGWTIAQLGRR